LPINSASSDRTHGAPARTAPAMRLVVGVAVCLVVAAACSSNHNATPAPPPAPAGSVGTDEVDINAINPIGPFFEHRLDYGITDSQVTKLSAIDSRYLIGARPVRRTLDSLRTQAHEFDGYLPAQKNADKNADTSHARRPARDSVQQLHDAIADVSAQLRARARHARAEALDVLTLEQLERVAIIGSGTNNYVAVPVTNRRGGTNGGRDNSQAGTTTTRMVANAVPTIRDPLRGITLSDSERVKVDSIRSAYRAEARELGDPVRSLAAPIRDLIRRQYDAFREVLTPEHQEHYDKNRMPATTPAPGQSATKPDTTKK
jgi:hypothetical protein